MAATFEEAWERACKIEGWLSKDQGQALFEFAGQVESPYRIVEIGSHRGRSTVLLALGAPSDVKVHAVDPFDDPRWGGGTGSLDRFLENLDDAGVRDRVDFFQGTSEEAAKEWSGAPVGLLFVDGAHDRESVLADIDGWTPWQVDCGWAFFHDAYSAPGVTAALFRRLLANNQWSYLGSRQSLAMFESNAPRTSGQRRVDRAKMIGRLAYFARNVAIKIGRKNGQNWVGPLLGWHEDAYPY